MISKPQRRSVYARVWVGGPYGDILTTLAAAAGEREGVLVLTGDVGTGKSLVTQALIETLRDREVLVGELPFPHLGPLDFLRTVAMAYGLPSAFETREAFQLEFEDFLRCAAGDGKRVMFVIDEAQQLTPGLFPELERLLRTESGPGEAARAPFSVLLVGAEELESILEEPSHAALARRITARCRLRPLTEEEVATYLAHRLAVGAGARELSTAVIREIHRESEGVPRIIDQVAQQIVVAAPVTPLRPLAPVVASDGVKRSKRRGRTHRRLQLTRQVVATLVAGGMMIALAFGITGYRVIRGRHTSPAAAPDTEARGGIFEQAATPSPNTKEGAPAPSDVQTPTDLQPPTGSNVTTTAVQAPETQQTDSAESDRPTPRPFSGATEPRPSLTLTPEKPQSGAGIIPTREEPPAPRPSSSALEPESGVAPARKKPQTPSPASHPAAAGMTPSREERRGPRPQAERARIPENPTLRPSSGATDPDPGAIIDWLLKERPKPR